MIIFYAFSHLNIIQCINTKIHYYNEEKTCLIVRVSPTISKIIVDIVRNSKVFDEVFYIDMPNISMKKIPYGKVKGLRTFSKMKVLNRFYENYLKECFGEEKCREIIISGGWNDAIFVTYYFVQQNPELKILFVEDGNMVYVKSRVGLYKFRPDMAGKNRVTRLTRFFAERKYLRSGLKHLGKEIYVSSVSLYEKKAPDKDAVPLALPCIDRENPDLFHVVQELAENNMREYEKRFYTDVSKIIIFYDKRKLIFFPDYEIPESDQLIILDIIRRKVHEKFIIVKVHNSVTAHKKNFALDYNKKHATLYVDRNDYYFESLYTKIDFSNKIFISRGSSLMMYTKQNWGQEPFLIFTYKLYGDYLHYGDVKQIDDAVLFCKSIYRDPSKVMVPQSRFEFENMVEEAYLRSLGY